MHRFLAIFISSVCGLSFIPMLSALPSIAHQIATSKTIGATIYLNPKGMPHAGQASQTWFMLTQSGGAVIPASDCDCQISVYDARDRAIAAELPPSTLLLEGHQAMGTTITFPFPGTYTVVLSGQSKAQRFDPFQLKFPVTVSP